MTGFCKGGYEHPGSIKDTKFFTSLGIGSYLELPLLVGIS